MALIELPYGKCTLPVNLPAGWLGQIGLPPVVRPASTALTLITEALNNPISSPPLAEIVRPGQQVAVIVDDYTRHTPVHLLLTPVLAQLLSAGIGRQDIRLVVAPGTHRPMTDDELLAKLGAAVIDQYEIINTPSTAASEMVYLGPATNGIPAWVNRAVVEADIRIGLGMITPHLEAGFTGGAKIILPGVCGEATVDAFHAASAFIGANQLGQVESPLRCYLERFVAEQLPLEFIVNVITTLEGEIYQCVAGHFIEAHRAGVSYAHKVYGTPVERQFPVVVANCYPYDLDLWQSIKGIWAGDLLTADGGTLIVVTAAPEGNSNYPLVPPYIGQEPEGLKQKIEAGTVKDAKQAATGVMFGRLKQRVRLALVSEGLTQVDAETMGVSYYESVEAAVAAEVKRLPQPDRLGSVAILPQAGVVLPLLMNKTGFP